MTHDIRAAFSAYRKARADGLTRPQSAGRMWYAWKCIKAYRHFQETADVACMRYLEAKLRELGVLDG